jgi:hypothetical protein
MPPFKLQIRCLDCGARINGYAVKALDRADKHARKTGHQLDAWRLTPKHEPTYFCKINGK